MTDAAAARIRAAYSVARCANHAPGEAPVAAFRLETADGGAATYCADCLAWMERMLSGVHLREPYTVTPIDTFGRPTGEKRCC